MPFAADPSGRRWPLREDHLRELLPLPREYRQRLVEPYAVRADRGRLSFESFIVSPDLRRQGGVYWALSQRFPATRDFVQPRVTDAVAVAGLQAARANRRRAVVLVTSDDGRDFSTAEPPVVVGYLSRLQVPLYVWHLGTGPPPIGWPEATAVGSYKELRRAVRALLKALSRQRVVWLDGSYHLESIRLAAEAAAQLVGPAL